MSIISCLILIKSNEIAPEGFAIRHGRHRLRRAIADVADDRVIAGRGERMRHLGAAGHGRRAIVRPRVGQGTTARTEEPNILRIRTRSHPMWCTFRRGRSSATVR